VHAPAIPPRRRRPFLAPIWLTGLFFLFLALVLAWAAFRSAAVTTVVIVRHAESARGSIADPPLLPEGEQRAERLASLFAAPSAVGRIGAIYVVPEERARATAAPLAARLRITPIALTQGDVGEAAARVLRERRGQAALVVTQAASIAQWVEVLGGMHLPPPAENDYGSIYVVSVSTLGGAAVLELHY
jgi:broad specificity phosphatase PhoE